MKNTCDIIYTHCGLKQIRGRRCHRKVLCSFYFSDTKKNIGPIVADKRTYSWANIQLDGSELGHAVSQIFREHATLNQAQCWNRVGDGGPY